MEEQNFEGDLKVNVLNEETPTKQEQEQAVLDQAVESGDIAPESAGYETLDDGTLKIDLDAIQKRETEEVPVGERAPDSEEVEQEVREQPEQEEPTEEKVLELVTEDEQPQQEQVEEETAPQTEEPVQEPQIDLPEGVDKLLAFMEETGGTLEIT